MVLMQTCPLVKSDLSSFVVNRFFMKMFRTNNMDIVRNCQSYFGFKLPSELWSNRVKMSDVKFMSRAGAALSVMALMSDRWSACLFLVFFCCFFVLL